MTRILDWLEDRGPMVLLMGMVVVTAVCVGIIFAYGHYRRTQPCAFFAHTRLVDVPARCAREYTR